MRAFDSKPSPTPPSPLRLRCQTRLEILNQLTEPEKLRRLLDELGAAFAKLTPDDRRRHPVAELVEVRLRRNLKHRLARLLDLHYRPGMEHFPELVEVISDHDEEYLLQTIGLQSALGR